MMQERCWTLVGLCALSLSAAACQVVESPEADEGDVAEAEQPQVPTNPDKVALVTILDQNSNPVIHVVSVGSSVPSGMSGVSAGREYWYTNTSSPPTLTGLSYSVTQTDRQADLSDFVSGWSLSLTCAQAIGEGNWSTWSSGTNSAGTLFRASDPTANDTYMGLYLEYAQDGRLGTYSWYRQTLLTGGFAYTATQLPSSFTAMMSTAPTSMQSGTWKYSVIVSPP